MLTAPPVPVHIRKVAKGMHPAREPGFIPSPRGVFLAMSFTGYICSLYHVLSASFSFHSFLPYFFFLCDKILWNAFYLPSAVHCFMLAAYIVHLWRNILPSLAISWVSRFSHPNQKVKICLYCAFKSQARWGGWKLPCSIGNNKRSPLANS